MSDSWRQALSDAKEFIQKQGGKIAPLGLSEEEINPTVQHDLTLSAFPLEEVKTYPVPFEKQTDSCSSSFRFFEDGRQRTMQIGYIPAQYGDRRFLIPIHFFCVSAAILERTDRKLRLWDRPVRRQGILVATSMLPDQSVLEAFKSNDKEVVDTGLTSVSGGANDYYDLRRRALTKAKDLRLDAEQELIRRWRTDPTNEDHFLVIDGTLMNLRDEENVNRCVGISKSFGSRFADVSDMNRVMEMPAGFRSWAFRYHNPEDPTDDPRKGVRERVSWYLRLREKIGADPEFGLVRVEISKAYADEAADKAGLFSKWLLSESLPTSHPTPRWDKHLYPIRACELYLSSIMPSKTSIVASMTGRATPPEYPEYEE